MFVGFGRFSLCSSFSRLRRFGNLKSKIFYANSINNIRLFCNKNGFNNNNSNNNNNIPIEQRPDWVLIGVEDCFNIFHLTELDLNNISCIHKFDPYDDSKETKWYYLRDAWELSIEKHGNIVQEWYKEYLNNNINNNDNSISYEALYGWQRKDIPPDKTNNNNNVFKLILNIFNIRQSQSILNNKDGSLNVVKRAVIANSLKFLLFVGFYYYTDSSTMLAEVYHSGGDLMNQIILGLAVLLSIQRADWTHPYGYGSRRWIASCGSGAVLFCMGLFSIKDGISDIFSSNMPQHLLYGVTLCSLTAVLELYSFVPAYKEGKLKASQQKMNLVNYLKQGTDSSTVHVLCEDGAGLSCSLIALISLLLTNYTSYIFIDDIGSTLIGSVLMFVGYFLVKRNLELVTGKSLPSHILKDILIILESSDIVASYHDIKSIMVGINSCMIKVEIDFNADKIADKYLIVSQVYPLFKNVILNEQTNMFHDLMMKSCAEYQHWLTLERHGLEKQIRDSVKGYGYTNVHIDIETY